MKYFIDTEFIEDGKTIDLISIGIVAEDGKELYLESEDCDYSKASQWVKDNVFPNLDGHNRLLRSEIKDEIIRYLKEDDGDIEFWGYYSDYDWVVFCQLFGKMIDLPDNYPKYCMDLKQLMRMKGIKIKQNNSNHNALQDARWIRQTYLELTKGEK